MASIYTLRFSSNRKFIYPFLGLIILVIILLIIGNLFFDFPGKFLRQNSAPKVSPEVEKVNQIIELVKNPDPELVAKYDVDPKMLESQQASLLCGHPNITNCNDKNDLDKLDQKNLPQDAASYQGYLSSKSLYGLRDLLIQGKSAEAKALLKSLLNQLSSPLSTKKGLDKQCPPGIKTCEIPYEEGDNDIIRWNKDQIAKYDPEGVRYPQGAETAPLSAIREKTLIEAFELYYSLKT